MVRGRVSLVAIRGLIQEGRIRLGMTKADVRELLGAPEAWGGSSRRYHEPHIWKYGAVEIWFARRRSRTPWPGPELTAVYAEDDDRPGEMLLGGS